MSYKEFIDDLNNVMASQKTNYPSQLLGILQSLSQQCESGYGDSIWDFSYEIGNRDQVELLITNPKLIKHEEFQHFIEEVSKLDDLMKKVLVLDLDLRRTRNNWWDRALPRYATADFIDQVRQYQSSDIADKIERID